jgi:hypothetical protein
MDQSTSDHAQSNRNDLTAQQRHWFNHFQPIVPLFLRQLVLGIPAQASGKNDAATHAFGSPSRPATLATSLYYAR